MEDGVIPNVMRLAMGTGRKLNKKNWNVKSEN